MTDTIDLDEVAAILKCSRRRVVALLHSGVLPGTKPGRDWIVPRDALFTRLNEIALEEAAERRRPAPAPAPELSGNFPGASREVQKRGRKRRPLATVGALLQTQGEPA